jgi:hypothetical protein
VKSNQRITGFLTLCRDPVGGLRKPDGAGQKCRTTLPKYSDYHADYLRVDPYVARSAGDL